MSANGTKQTSMLDDEHVRFWGKADIPDRLELTARFYRVRSIGNLTDCRVRPMRTTPRKERNARIRVGQSRL